MPVPYKYVPQIGTYPLHCQGMGGGDDRPLLGPLLVIEVKLRLKNERLLCHETKQLIPKYVRHGSKFGF